MVSYFWFESYLRFLFGFWTSPFQPVCRNLIHFFFFSSHHSGDRCSAAMTSLSPIHRCMHQDLHKKPPYLWATYRASASGDLYAVVLAFRNWGTSYGRCLFSKTCCYIAKDLRPLVCYRRSMPNRIVPEHIDLTWCLKTQKKKLTSNFSRSNASAKTPQIFILNSVFDFLTVLFAIIVSWVTWWRGRLKWGLHKPMVGW